MRTLSAKQAEMGSTEAPGDERAPKAKKPHVKKAPKAKKRQEKLDGERDALPLSGATPPVSASSVPSSTDSAESASSPPEDEDDPEASEQQVRECAYLCTVIRREGG